MDRPQKSYHRRRKTGCQPGSHHGEGVPKYMERAVEHGLVEQVEAEGETAGGLHAEIIMLRAAMRELDQVRRQAATPQEKVHAAHIMSLVGKQLAAMLLAQNKLGEGDDEVRTVLHEALRQVADDLGLEDPFS